MITGYFLDRSRLGLWVCALLVALVSSSCSHTLTVKNIDLYKPEFADSPLVSSKLGILSSTNSPAEERLLLSVANNLKKNGFKVTYPFFPKEDNRKAVDFVIKMMTSSQFEGSGWNFLINWPGFLIWTPAWHGYNYGAVFGFDIDITDTQSDSTLPRLSVPVDLVIRHAAINRTWTEISWLEWSAIAFIGGIVFTRYDKSVTPLLIDEIENKVGDYVASKISRAVFSAAPSAQVVPAVEMIPAEVAPKEVVTVEREPLPVTGTASKGPASLPVAEEVQVKPGR